MERGSAAEMSSSREGKEAEARPIIPTVLRYQDGWEGTYLSAGH